MRIFEVVIEQGRIAGTITYDYKRSQLSNDAFLVYRNGKMITATRHRTKSFNQTEAEGYIDDQIKKDEAAATRLGLKLTEMRQ